MVLRRVTAFEATSETPIFQVWRSNDVLLEDCAGWGATDKTLQAYGSDRLHWYVPEEVEAIDRAKAAGAEILRDQLRKTMMGR